LAAIRMNYFVWAARGGGRTFVVDTGFNAEVSETRKRKFLRSLGRRLPRSASMRMRLKMSS